GGGSPGRNPDAKKPAVPREERRALHCDIDKAGTHAEVRDRCFLPDLAGLTSPRCPDHNRCCDNGTYNNDGERGIRTLDALSDIHAFQACAFNRSATSPSGCGERRIRTYDTVAGMPDFESGAFDHSASSPAIHLFCCCFFCRRAPKNPFSSCALSAASTPRQTSTR